MTVMTVMTVVTVATHWPHLVQHVIFVQLMAFGVWTSVLEFQVWHRKKSVHTNFNYLLLLNLPKSSIIPILQMRKLIQKSHQKSGYVEELFPQNQHGLEPARLLCPWDFPGKNTGADSHSILQGIFPTQGSNLCFLYHRQILYHLSHQESSFQYYLENITSLGKTFFDVESLIFSLSVST